MIRRFRKWRGEKLKLRAEAVWLLDELLDHLPAWNRHSGWHDAQWGCTLRLHRYWDKDKFRKEKP
jgi:hypothetical protein